MAAIDNAIKSVSVIAYASALPALTPADDLVLVTKGYVDTVAGAGLTVATNNSGLTNSGGLAVGEGNGITVSGTAVSVAGYGKNIKVDGNGVSATIPAWAANTAYVAGDVVYNNSVIYVCSTGKAHTSGNSFDTTKWTAISSTITSTSHNHTSAQISDGLTTYDATKTTASYVVKTDGSTGKISSTLLPDLAVTDVFTTTTAGGRTSQTTAKQGDICVETVSGVAKAYILVSDATDAFNNSANWRELLTSSQYQPAGNYQPAGDYALSSTVSGIDSRVTSLENAGYLTSSTGVTTFGGKSGVISVTGSNGLTFNATSKTLSMNMATTISTNDSDSTNHYTSDTAGSVKLATYKSTDNDNKGYWSTSGSDAFAATPKGVAAYTADTYQPKGNYAAASAGVPSQNTAGYAFVSNATSGSSGTWEATITAASGITSTASGLVQGKAVKAYVDSRSKYATITGSSSNTQKTYTITHGLNVGRLIVQVYDSSNNLVLVDTTISNTTVVLNFAEAPKSNYTAYIYAVDGAAATVV